MLQGVSTNGTTLCAQLGTAGGFVTSGYSGACGDQGTPASYSTDFRASPGFSAGGAFTLNGTFSITNITGNTWIEQHMFGLGNTNSTCWGGGSVALSGTLTQVRLTTANGTDVFDAGTVNVMYE